MDITQLILDDHHEQRRRFAILEQIDSPAVRTLSDIWVRLSVFLEVHAAAEEEIFYPELVRLALAPNPVSAAEAETIDAIHDHNEIRDAIAVVAGHPVGSPGWRDAVAAVNRANGDHMAEEEREGLTDFAGVRPVDRDPEDYVRQQELAARSSGAPGSLGIGNLKGY